MINDWILLLVSALYVGVLFALAYYGDRRPLYPARAWLRPIVYSLALAVYCSSWTFYGAVGKNVNAPRSHIYGVEGELDWAPVAGLEITQGLSWRKGKYDQFDDLDIAASTAAGHGVTVSRAGRMPACPTNPTTTSRIAG